MNRNNLLFSLAFLTLMFDTLLLSAPGGLDTTFGTNGIVLTQISRNDYISSCTVQADDSIVVGGSGNGYYQQTDVARYTPNGTLDPSFNTTGNTQGVQSFRIGSASQGTAITLQSNEKILITGYASENTTNTALTRFDTDGTFDTSFNSTGSVTTQVYSGATAYSVLVQPDTNIVIAGLSYNNQSDFMLVRYDASGNLDPNFGNGGKVTTAISAGATINQIALQTDGKIVAGGYAYDNSSNPIFCLARYNSNGTVDQNFGTNGVVLTTIGTGSAINSITIQNDGYIVAAGYTVDTDGITKFALARYDTNGALDTNFNTTGRVITGIQYEAKAQSVILQANGKIVVGGYSYGDLATEFALVRYNANGTIDTSFGTNGITLTTINGNNSTSKIKSLAMQSNGNIIAAGYSNTSFAIARYLAA